MLNLKSSVNANSSKGLNSNRLFRTSWASNLSTSCRSIPAAAPPSSSFCSSSSLERGYLPALTCKTRASFDIFLAGFFLAFLFFFFSHATRRVDWHRILTPRQPISCPILLMLPLLLLRLQLLLLLLLLLSTDTGSLAVLAVCFLNPFIKGATAFFAVAVNMIFRLRFSLFKIPCSACVVDGEGYTWWVRKNQEEGCDTATLEFFG